jgi:O-6-methylguanine DNA methyltransferase
MTDEIRSTVFSVPGWGWIGLAASARGVRLLTLPKPDNKWAVVAVSLHYPEAVQAPHDACLVAARTQIEEYFQGKRALFTVELDLRGHTTFELAIWSATGRIPFGETRSYGWIAWQAGGGTGAAQAVGAALGANPVPLLVPCHRVVGSDGTLHGFAGGLEMKTRLLSLETRQLALPLE